MFLSPSTKLISEKSICPNGGGKPGLKDVTHTTCVTALALCLQTLSVLVSDKTRVVTLEVRLHGCQQSCTDRP